MKLSKEVCKRCYARAGHFVFSAGSDDELWCPEGSGKTKILVLKQVNKAKVRELEVPLNCEFKLEHVVINETK